VPANSYRIDLAEGCGGTLAGDLFTTAPVAADCTVTVLFAKKFPWFLFMPRGSR